MRKRNTVDAWIKETVETFGKLDGAANMAGVIGKNHGKMMVSMSFHLRYMAETNLHSRLQKRLEMNGFLSWMSISKVRPLDPRESLDLRTHDVAGVMHSMSAELKALSEGGSIVNAASICGLIGLKGAGAYCASKLGVIGLTRAHSCCCQRSWGEKHQNQLCGPVSSPVASYPHSLCKQIPG
jgi:NAD(P)-dependent dehydrogenase (short-subunit alcohol dehydrogenase family)